MSVAHTTAQQAPAPTAEKRGYSPQAGFALAATAGILAFILWWAARIQLILTTHREEYHREEITCGRDLTYSLSAAALAGLALVSLAVGWPWYVSASILGAYALASLAFLHEWTWRSAAAGAGITLLYALIGLSLVLGPLLNEKEGDLD